MRIVASSGVLAVCLFACSGASSGTGGGAASNRVALDAATLCNRVITECKQSTIQASCDLAFTVMRVTPECKSTLETASCEVLDQVLNGSDQTCFPSCTNPGDQACNGDGTITSCSSSRRQLVLDCEASCQKGSNPPKSFSGTCGTAFNNQQSTDGEEKCWCQ